ncbi:MAG: endonuclease/exonuclease/phosphatase family protein [Bacteroidales bacterium]|nr:endonuclease/exonuclease/phosphatase family protein [Bacteroidales bacterium]
MKNLLITLAVLGTVVTGCISENDLRLEVISLNIRYDNPRDGNNAWPYRKNMVVSFLQEQQPDIFGLQEALWYQYKFIDSLMISYSSVGMGRDDGRMRGEMGPLFYNNTRFRLIESEIFWLSETPDVAGSKGWGAMLPRIVTWVKLRDKDSGEDFYFFNTHYSHMSDSARLMSSSILLDQVKKITGDSFFVITGDFNMLPESKAYQTLTEEGNASALIRDTYILSETEPSGPACTFNGFNDSPCEGRIDYIFIRDGTSVKNHTTIILKNDSLFLSDHWPVKASLILSF